MTALPWTYDDGGRAAAGYRGTTGDCVTRAAAIVTGRPYQEVYDLVNALARRERPRQGRTRSSARTGVHKATTRRLFDQLGLLWVPTMAIGSGTTVHLAAGELSAGELPDGAIAVQVSGHVTTVVEGWVRDLADPTRDGTRCVYGYWTTP